MHVAKVRPSLIIHAAGRVGGIAANMREPVAFLDENWQMGRNIILAAREAGVRKLINLGSSCMYPKDIEHPIREDDLLTGPLEPTNEAYAIAKIATQRLCSYVSAETPDLSYKTLIPCNLFGPYDTFDAHRSHLAAAVIHKLHEAKVAGAETVEIWGDGSARREFLFVRDLAEAIFLAAERFDTLPPVVNIGAGIDHSVNDYYQIAADVLGYRGAFTHDLSKPVGMKRKLMDITLARTLGLESRTSLREGLAATYEHYLTAVHASR